MMRFPQCPTIGLLIAFAAASVLAIAAPPVRADDADLAELEERAMKAAVARVAPSVVRLETFGGLEKVGQLLVGTGPTTGLIVSPDGFILSSAFNFARKPTSILATLPGGRRAAAKIVARDRSRMLVLLKVDAPDALPVAPVAPRDQMRVGQWTLAVGRTLDAGGIHMSAGVLSATDRIWSRAVQTDAKISPSNYGGPLVDIRGRVLGVLVPLSPKGPGSEIAGAEWYDSGIGFAVPLADVLPQLEKMKRGEDLLPGLLGVALKRGNANVDPAVVGASRPNSPAAKAGIEAGDRIVEVNGRPIGRQADLKHALGPLYEGQQVRLVVLRGDERREMTAQLAGEIVPYRHPFLGLLPARGPDPTGGGFAVRFVYPDSPAARAGIRAGDRVVALAGKDVPNALTLREEIASLSPGDSVAVSIHRGTERLQLDVTLGELPTDIPAELPPAGGATEPAGDPGVAVGSIEIKLPEEPGTCYAYVPAGYDGDVPHGLVVWLAAPGRVDRDKFLARWKDRCDQNGLIALAPQPADAARWTPTDVALVRKTIEHVTADYHVDPARVVVHGHQAGAGMAWLAAFGLRDLVRGVAAVDSAPPARAALPENEPIRRLAVYLATAGQSPQKDRQAAVAKQLADRHFPVTVKDLGPAPRYLNDEELDELVRWLDALDRI